MIRNATLRQYLKYASVFVVGLLAGAWLMSRVAQRSIDGAVASVRSQFRSNEAFRAVRERCSKRPAAAVPHAWNYAVLSESNEVREFDLPRDEARLFAYPMLAGMADDLRVHRGMKIDAAIARAKLAVTLEEAGHAKLADAQWDIARRAAARDGHKVDRAFVKALLERECEDRPWEKLKL